MYKYYFSILMLIMTVVLPSFASDTRKNPPPMPPAPKPPISEEVQNENNLAVQNKYGDMKKRKEEFEKRLKLTDEQKTKAKEIREEGRKEMKPVMNAIQAKLDELKMLQETNAAKEEFDAINRDIRKLHKKAHDIKMQNMKEFEEILTNEQKKELWEMKKEGRKDFELRQKDCEKTDTCKRPSFFKEPPKKEN